MLSSYTQMGCLAHPLGYMHLTLESTSLGYSLGKSFNLMGTGIKIDLLIIMVSFTQ